MFKLSDNDLVKSASYASVSVSLIILSAKIYAWLITESQSVLASLIDSMLDISSSLINLVAIKVALTPPDDNHRFGHEKFEDLAIFSQSIFFFASSIFTSFSAFKALYSGAILSHSTIGAQIMFWCIGLTFFLVCYQSYVVKRTHSAIIAADKLHYFTDFLSNIAVIVSLYLTQFYWYFDALTGIGISVYVIYASYKLFKKAIKNLADEELPFEDKQKILKIVGNYSQVKGLHELKTRYAASKAFIQFHLELDGNMTLNSAHDIAEEIASMLLIEFPNAEIIIHQDPEGAEQDVNYRERI